jgi:threonine synthase
MHNDLSLIERYKAYLPVTEKTPVVSLGEGFTPLIKAKRLMQSLGHSEINLYFKLEGLNPTGSFKDRGMTMAVSKAIEEGNKSIICASTGNTSASAAAFAAAANLNCYVILPTGQVALGKVAQALIYGAKIFPIEGNYDQALELVRQLAKEHRLTPVNSINPYRLQGQKTAAFEIIEQLGAAPDYLCIPVGNAGNISSYWEGFTQWQQEKKTNRTPKMWGFEAAGCAALVEGHPVLEPKTIATAIRIGNPANWQSAINAAKESGGVIDSVTDEQILNAYQLLAKCEGIFCEPASAASVAGLLKRLERDPIKANSTFVCVLTGNGLKDPDIAMKTIRTQLIPLPANIKHLKEAMNL